MLTLRPVLLAYQDQEHSDLQLPSIFDHVLEDDSAFQDSLERVSDSIFLPPLVITTPSQKESVIEQCEDIAYEIEELLITDQGMNENAIQQMILDWCEARGENFPLLIFPTHHFVADYSAFMRAIEEAGKTAEKGYLVRFGVMADFASVDCDYIKVGTRLDAEYMGHHILDYQVKPDAVTAQSCLDSGTYVWDCDMVCAMPETLKNAANDKQIIISLLSAWANVKTWPGIWKMLSL